MANDSSELEELGESVIKTELPLTFETLAGTAVPATVTRICFRRGIPDSSCEMTFEVNAETAHGMLQQEWFHLFRGMRSGSPSFQADQPVQFKAALRAELANRVADAGGDAETVMDLLLPQASNGNVAAIASSFRCTECWLALEATQTSELPDALKDTGTLRIGFRTAWIERTQADLTDAGSSAGSTAQRAGVLDRIEAFLQEKELDYEKLDEQLLRLRIVSENGDWICLIRIEESEDCCVAYSVYPNLIPLERREATALFMMSVNYDLAKGSFEMDHEDGELRFRTSMPMAGRSDPAEFGTMLIEHAQVMEQYLPAIQDMIDDRD